MTTSIKYFGEVEGAGIPISGLYTGSREAKAVIRAVNSSSYIVENRNSSQQTTVTTALSAFTTALSYLTSGRSGIEKIVCYGDFDLASAASAVSIPSYTEVETLGRYLLPASPALNRCIFDINTATNVIIRGGRFTNTAYTNAETAGQNGAVINIQASTYVTVLDTFISGYAGTAINVSQTSQYISLQRCNIEKVAGKGIWIQTSNYVNVSQNIIRLTGRGTTLNAVGDGVCAENTFCTRILISNNQITSTGRNGIRVDKGASGCTVSRNRVTSTLLEGIKIECTGGSGTTSAVTVVNNVVTTCTDGFYFNADTGGKLSYLTVSDNVSSGNSGSGFFVGARLEYVTIQSNLARGNPTGINVPNLTGRINLNVVNNVATNNTSDYFVQASSGTFLTGNLDSGTSNVSSIKDTLVVSSSTASTSTSTGAVRVSGGMAVGGSLTVTGGLNAADIKSSYCINQFWYLSSNTASSDMGGGVILASASWTLHSDDSVVNSSGTGLMDTNGMITMPIKGIYVLTLHGRFGINNIATGVWFEPGTGQGHSNLPSGSRLGTAEMGTGGIHLCVTYTSLFQSGDTINPVFWAGGTSYLETTGTTLSVTLLQLVA